MGIGCIDKEKLNSCSRCGKCSSGCEVNRLDPAFQPHKLMHLLGMVGPEALLNSEAMWKCSTCFTCAERCPQGIRITDILWSIRACVVRSGRIPEMVAAQKDSLLKTGRLYPVSQMDNQKREKAGLPPLAEGSDAVARLFKAAETDE